MRNPCNTRVVLARRPGAVPGGDDFRIEQHELPPVRDRQVLLRTLAISIDGCASKRARDTSLFEPGMALGEVMRGATVSEVVESRHPAFKPGDAVLAWSGWQEREVVDGSDIRRKLHRNAAPPLSALGVFGIWGHIAYKAMHEVARPVAGETVLIGSAASPAGEVAGQIARQRGARVVGVTSSAEKCAWLVDELEFDVALDRNAPDFDARLRAACPDGIDVLLLGTESTAFERSLPLLNMDARMPVWGTSMLGSDALRDTYDRMPYLLSAIANKRLAVASWSRTPVSHLDALQLNDPEFIATMARWLRDGTIRYREDVQHGLHTAPQALERLVRGDNFGKLIVQLASP